MNTQSSSNEGLDAQREDSNRRGGDYVDAGVVRASHADGRRSFSRMDRRRLKVALVPIGTLAQAAAASAGVLVEEERTGGRSTESFCPPWRERLQSIGRDNARRGDLTF